MGYILLILGLGVSVFFYTAVRDLPSVEGVLKKGVAPTHYAQVFASDESVILSYGKFRHRQVRLREVSPYFVDALLSTEDRRFYQHHGVDPMALFRAVIRDVLHQKLLEGGSTLTQQLARNVFLSNERSFRRKIREAILAVEIENQLSKEEILELYINNIYFGEGAYGIAAASEIYFNKTPDKLTIDEAAMLAGMPQAPSNYSPFRNPKAAEDRRNEVLSNMQEWGKLTEGQVELFSHKSFHLNPEGTSLGAADKAPFFNRYVLKQIQDQFDLDEQSFWQSGLRIYTTLDSRAQAIASRVVKEQSLNAGRNKLKQQAALLCLNPKTGGILAYVGGKNYEQSQFDRITSALRSPGSLFKVFTYTAAMEKGIDPTKHYLDEPIFFGTWHPENFDREHHGSMPLYRAFYTSNNVIAVKLLRELTPSVVIDLARRMGLHANLADNLSLTLGGSGVTLLDITAAFSVLANQGVRSEPYAIERILDTDGHELYSHKPLKNEVLQRPTVDTMVSIMMNVVQKGTGRSADIGRQAAGKTGTSDDHRDAWFIGFTPDLITGVWVGNDDNTTMPGMVGGALPAAIWRNYMQAVVANRLQTNFDLTYSKLAHPPKGVVPADPDANENPVQTEETLPPPDGENTSNGPVSPALPPPADENAPSDANNSSSRYRDAKDSPAILPPVNPNSPSLPPPPEREKIQPSLPPLQRRSLPSPDNLHEDPGAPVPGNTN